MPSTVTSVSGHYYDTPQQGTDGKYTFWMDIKVKTTGQPQDVQFYLLGNEGGGQATTTFNENTSRATLDGCSFTGLNAVGTNGIPMTVKETKTVSVAENGTTNTATGHEGHSLSSTKLEFSLERAVGKLDVFFVRESDNDMSVTVKKITVLEPGRRSYNNYFVQDPLKVTDWSGNNDFTLYNGGTNPMSIDKNLSEDATDTDRGDSDNYASVFTTPYYPFETNYGSDNPDEGGSAGYDEGGTYRGNVLQIDYTVDGVDKTKNVYLPAIDRNHYYKVLCAVPKIGGIIISYAVSDWNVKEWLIVFEHASASFEPLTEGDYSTDVWYNGGDFRNGGAFCVIFQMTQPLGQPWSATISDNTNYGLTVYKRAAGSDNTNLEEVEKDDWQGSNVDEYLIYVYPQYPAVAENECVLKISTKSWSGPNDLLLINEEGFWNASSAGANDGTRTEIRIRQVQPPTGNTEDNNDNTTGQ